MGDLRLTRRGRIVIASIAVLVFLLLNGVAGWIEGGMQ